MLDKTIILDANLLLLLVVGLTSRTYISKHKRLRPYNEFDFDLLEGIVGSATKIVVTPHTLAETSNLIGYIGEPAREQIYLQLRLLLGAFHERHVESVNAAQREEFPRLGLADAVQLELAAESHTLLTIDLDLYLAARRRGLKAENFNYLRNM
ncbi:MAG: hypothetical protein ACREE2_15285 [Stellaceae bacterium]